MFQGKLAKAALILLFAFLLIAGIVFAKSFLLPVVFALMFSMLLLRKCQWLDNKGFPKWLSILTCLLVVFAIFSGIMYLLVWQISGMDTEISQVTDSIADIQRSAKKYIGETLGISRRETEELVHDASPKDKGPEVATAILVGLTGIFTNMVLTLVYVFLFLLMRAHLKKFVLMLLPERNKENANTIMRDSVHVANGYISGLAKMIVSLWIMYAIGFSIAGIKQPIMFAVICGTLEIVPFVGNITGTVLTIIMATVQGGGTDMVLAIVAVYAVVQFVQTYLLEPLVVGTEVNLNPLFTIVAIVLGEILWGIAGMILAIPVLGMVKIVCDNIEELKPFGFLLGQSNGRKKKKEMLSKLRARLRRDKE